MKDNGSTKYDLLIERLCETFGALYQGVTIDKTWLCERFGIAERTAYRDLARLAHVLDEVSSGRFKLTANLLPSLHTGHLAEFDSFAGVAHLFPHHDGQSLRKGINSADVTLHVSAHAATFVTRRPLFPAQRLLEKHQDGSITITTAIGDQNTLFRWLRYWLPDIRIVAPATLSAAFTQDLHARCEPATHQLPQDA